MSKLDKAIKKIEEQITPDILQPVVHPPEYYGGTKGGRPFKDEIVRLQEKVAKRGDYYLTNAHETIVSNLATTMPCPCSFDCLYISACNIDEKDRPYNGKEHELSGKRCPIEYQIVMTAFYGYLTELQITEQRPSEIQTAADLAGLQVMKRRFNIILGDDGAAIEQGVGVTKQGEAIMRKEFHPVFVAKEKLEKQEAVILKQFEATRKQQREAAQTKFKSAAQLLSDIDGEE